MGLNAKICNGFIKAINIPCLKTNTTTLVLNHVYADPSAMYASAIKNQRGGEGLKFMAHISIQCAKSLDKNEKKTDEDKEIQNAYKGNKLTFFIVIITSLGIFIPV